MAEEFQQLAHALGEALQARGLKLAVAESCTGGLICKLITDIGGSSAWFERGFVTYANAAKIEMLSVGADTLEDYGAVSEQVLREMLRGVLQQSSADWAAAVTGVAGPSGGSEEKPVGLVYLGWQSRTGAATVQRHNFKGGRGEVRSAAARSVLSGLCEALRA